MQQHKRKARLEIVATFVVVALVVALFMLLLSVAPGYAQDLPPCPPGTGVCVRATYLESVDADVATCQVEITRSGETSPILVQSEEFVATRTNQPRAVVFRGNPPGAVPDARFDLALTCKDEGGQRSGRSNVASVTIPRPPNPPPPPPVLQACSFTIVLADGTVQTPACIVVP